MISCALQTFSFPSLPCLFSFLSSLLLLWILTSFNHILSSLPLSCFALFCLVQLNSVVLTFMLPPPAIGPPFVPEANRLHPPLLPLCKDLPPGSGGLTSLKGHFISFENRNPACFYTSLQPACSSTSRQTPLVGDPSWVNVASIWKLTFLGLQVKETLEKPFEVGFALSEMTDFGGRVVMNPSFKGCMGWSVDWRTTEVKQDWARSREMTFGQRKTDWALLSHLWLEGLDTCSVDEKNSLLIQSKCNGKLPSIYQLYNLFTISSERTFWISLSHFSSPNTWHTVEKLHAFVFVSVPWNVLLVVSAFIIGTLQAQSPAQLPKTWQLTQIQNVTVFF